MKNIITPTANIIKHIIIFFVFNFCAYLFFSSIIGIVGFSRKEAKIIAFAIAIILYCLIIARKNIIWALKPSTIKIHLKGELSIYEIIVFIFCLIPTYIVSLGSASVCFYFILPYMESWYSKIPIVIITSVFWLLVMVIFPALVLGGIIVKFVKSLRK